VLAATGFESNVTIEPNDAWNDWQWLHGADQTTGVNFDTNRLSASPWPWGTLSIVCSASGSCPTSGVPSDYVSGTIESVTGRKGSLTRALRVHSKKPNPNACCQQVGFANTEFNSPLRDYYMRAYVRLNPELASQAASIGSNYWRTFWVFKTTVDQRIHIQILNNHAGGPTWYIQSDDTGGSCNPCNQVPYWRVDSAVKVPLDQWFLLEIYFHRSNDSSGRFFFAVNGQKIVDRLGPNLGFRQDEIAVISHSIVYIGGKMPGWNLVDDVEIRDRPPCAALPCGPPA
jgi:hypothetical protein